MDNETQSRINSDLDEQEHIAREQEALDRRRRDLAAGSATPSKPELSQTPDTPLTYRGEDRVPLQAGSEFVVFSTKRPTHMVPRRLALSLVARSPEEWEISKDVPDYGDDTLEDHFDVDTAHGRDALRRAFFSDPEGTYQKITVSFWKKINELEKQYEELKQENAVLKGKLASASGDDREQRHDAPPPVNRPKPKNPGINWEEIGVAPEIVAVIEPYLDPTTLENALNDETLSLHFSQQATIRSSHTNFIENRSQKSAEEFAEKLIKYKINPSENDDSTLTEA